MVPTCFPVERSAKTHPIVASVAAVFPYGSGGLFHTTIQYPIRDSQEHKNATELIRIAVREGQ